MPQLPWRCGALVLASVLGGAACSGSQGSSSAGSSGSGSSGSHGSGTSSSSGGSSSGGTNCNVPEFVTTSLELTTQCNPWLIGALGTDVEGSGDPVLSVDPGVTISVAAGGFLAVGLRTPGTLQVNGTSANPVTFTSSTATPGSWMGILFSDYSSASSITSATISYAGSPPSILPGLTPDFGAIVVEETLGNPVLVTLNGVTVEKNGANGIVFAGHLAGLVEPGSGSLTASDWASGSYPFVVDANEAGTLPASLVAGAASGTAAVAIECQAQASCGSPMTVDHTQTWPAIPMPYLIASAGGVNVEGTSGLAILTIEAPNTLEFIDGSVFLVDSLGSGYGALVASGTAANHIVFKSNDPSPAWNAWQGIGLTASVTDDDLATSSLSYCDISDASSFVASVNVNADQGCGPLLAQGMLFLDGTALMPGSGPSFGLPFAIGPAISHCTFSNYGGCAILTDGISNGTSYGPYDDITDHCAQLQDGGAAGNVFQPFPGTDGGPYWIKSAVCLFDSTDPD